MIQIFIRSCYFFLFLIANSPAALAQSPLQNLLNLAEKNYPALQAKTFQTQAAKAGIDLQRNTRLPSVDLGYQLNFATYNNITGMSAPLGWVPISGPPSSGNNFSGVFGSSIGALANWQPITFGQREADVEHARKSYEVALADKENDLYLHKAKVINAYLDYMASLALVEVQDENLRRLEEQLHQSRTLVANGLRPGVDTALVKSEVSKTKIERLNVLKTVQLRLIQLNELLAEKNIAIAYDSTMFSRLPDIAIKTASLNHPAVNLANTTLDALEAQKSSLQKSWYPKLNFWGTLYGRGSGVDYTGDVRAADGFGLSRLNYGVGAQLSMPLMKFSELNIQLRQQNARINAAKAEIAQTELQLSKEQETSDVLFHNALAIEHEMPEQLETADFAYKAMNSRYSAGLVTYNDLLQTQYNLEKAQTDAKIARYSVWKALLYQAAAAGDLNIFLSRY